MSDDVLLWLDLETTGLEPDRPLLQVAAIATDTLGNELAAPIEWIVAHTPEEVETMRAAAVPVVQDMHAVTGLWDRLSSGEGLPLEDVEALLLAYVRRVAPNKGQAQLAGNSVHMDAIWTRVHLPQVADHLHYRLIDITALATTMVRWGVIEERPTFEGVEHDAVDDIRGAVNEYRWLRRHLTAARV